MGVGRLSPHRVRAKYARALAEIPLPLRSFDRIDPSALKILAENKIGGRGVRFGVLAGTPRLWVAFTDELPPVLGYLTGLSGSGLGSASGRGLGTMPGSASGSGRGTVPGSVSGTGLETEQGTKHATGHGTGHGTGVLELHVTEPDHLEWSRQQGRARAVKAAGLDAWLAAQRECEG